ncbi:mitochondrial CDP-diacylglycerol--glycerol-3-phosphate 3-phosphatidyltransferase [Andalucia godoyi]|uniref:CDP-diacylglycerol--glycerol-3-phosphate 3-phosphatidyltransferase n=1 Tax=Andalucia godoyi TaxID=505711 RepID=A0A8K0F0P2_ANDGO|nr:mitochondrial CDP-diacylglycerol--glycerol-3-phosphate 3-phosphatidyltransferase [Andalucia godoyi]|eukprot:ANDGO_00017.mRNA.1 mitochondrial CDP-diacylglycerol--glycerol-3-phosphate 3-phosphatidyltransferase
MVYQLAQSVASGFRAIRLPNAASQVRVLSSPTEFYNTLLERLGSSRRRVILGSLYLGDASPLEQRLLQGIHASLSSIRQLEVRLLLDCSRSMRGNAHVRQFCPIKSEHGSRFQVHLFTAPQASRSFVGLVPERLREVFGVQHVKCYVFDDAVIMSGANLSDQYFENRQDRYIMFENVPELADWYQDLVCVLAGHSKSLDSQGLLHRAPASPSSSSSAALREDLLHLLKPSARTEPSNMHCDSFVVPTLQLGSLGLRTEEFMLDSILARISASSSSVSGSKSAQKPRQYPRIAMSTAYMNLTRRMQDGLIMQSSPCPLEVITSSPAANGFYTAKGMSGHIPSAYAYLEQTFIDRARRYGQASRIKVMEYARDNWTFHAKGLWAFSNRDDGSACGTAAPPEAFTFVGSSNYGIRSMDRDLESQCLLATRNPTVVSALESEVRNLERYCNPRSSDAKIKVPFWVPFATERIKQFF